MPLLIRTAPRVFLHGVLWTILCTGFVLGGVRKIWPVFASGHLRPAQPFDSTDLYLETLMHTKNGSVQILRALDGVPADKQIALFLPDADRKGAFAAQCVIYLIWPREIRWLVAKDEAVSGQLRAIDPNSLGAVIFWGVKPPDWLPEGIRIGPEQIIVRLPSRGEPDR